MARLVELANHLVALLLTPALVAVCLLVRPAWPVELALWAAWLAAALLFDAWSPRVSAVAPADRPDGATILLLLWLPPLAMAGVLAWALALAERGAFDAGQFALAAFGLGLRPWHWRNRMTRALLLQAVFVAGIAALFGPAGLGLFLAQTVVAGLLILGIDYTQHYGVVRRTLGNGRLEPITGVHAWTSD